MIYKNKINHHILIVLFTTLLLVLSSCSTVKQLSSQVIFVSMLETPSLHLSDISIIDHRGIPGDTDRVRNFLLGIANQTDVSLQIDATRQFWFTIDIKETSFTQKLDQIFSIVLTLRINNPLNDTLIYQGLMIYESDQSISSANLLYSLLEIVYLEMAASLRVE